MPKDVKEMEYPPKVTTSGVLKGLWQASKLDVLFHVLMAVLLISGLLIDLLGVFLGGWLTPVRQIAHGYIGFVYIIVFIFYIIRIVATRRIRMLMTGINWLDFVLYAVLIVTGISIASVNRPWIDILPWLPGALGFLSEYSPALHTIITYVWLLLSTIIPGGFLHGIATSYLIHKGNNR